MKKSLLLTSLLGLGLFLGSCGTQKEESQEVNVYTHRHYDVDQEIFDKFTAQTGITVNVVNASADELIERLVSEGEQSPADVLITVDAGRLNRAQSMNLLQPIQSEFLNNTIPSEFRDPEGHWFGITYRARIIAYSKERGDVNLVESYEDLTKPELAGKVLIRSSDNVYNQSLLASIVAASGEEEAEKWAKGMVTNFAREPKGNDRDQVKAIASGEGDYAVVNTYYIGLMLTSDNEEEKKAAESIGIIFPNQEGRGTHVNVSGLGVTKNAPNKDNAIKFIEFLANEEAQNTLASFNFEYPTNPNVKRDALLDTWGDFKRDPINLASLGINNEAAIKIFDKVGWK